jgi:hypothetical protein
MMQAPNSFPARSTRTFSTMLIVAIITTAMAMTTNYDDDPMTDHPFGAYYHWCALLCGFGESGA